MLHNMKKIKIIGIWFFLMILLISNSWAIGLAPSRTIIDFESHLKKTIDMKLINNENRIVFAKLYVKGDLKDYIKIPQTEIKLQPNEIKSFYVKLELPNDFDKPGLNDNRIGAVETSDPDQDAGAMIGAVAGVESQLWIKVPHKEKYIEATLIATNVKSGEEIKLTLSLINQGIYDLTNVYAEFYIYDSNDKLIRTLKSETISLEKQAKTSIELTTSSNGLQIGKYKLIAKVQYDGLEKNIEADFKVGDFLIKITKIEIPSIVQGSIGEILVYLENFWPETIDGIEFELQLKKDNNVFESLSSGPYSIMGWENKIIPIYWKSENNVIGDYKAKLIVNYGGKTIETEESFKIVLQEENIDISILLPLILIIIVILGIITCILILSRKIKFK